MALRGSARARRALLSLLTVLTLAGGLVVPVAQASANRSALHVVLITAKNFTYEVPATIPAGLVEFIFENRGSQTHEAQFFRLKSGATESKLITALGKPDIKPTLAIAAGAGGAASVLPGGRQDVILSLRPGRYVAACFEAGSDNIPHFLKGMHKSFVVTSNARAASDNDDALLNGAPRADSVVVLRDYQLRLPAVISRDRPLMLRVRNNGPQTHQMEITKLNAGKTLKDYLRALQSSSGTPPGKAAGGIDALAPFTSGWVELRLAPGNYVAACFVPDIKTNKPHAEMGMVAAFTVR
ncbi:MAG: hypothetical protein IVW57_07415 [Ktedonobacterales bacterium]|nr:hypothetical protein [Ktedonobacterales bacterium]